MRKKVGIIKRVICISLVFLLSINSFAAIVSDNDGAAFITKAEFDSLKNNFQAQIDNYNTSIDSKIDGAIGAYLAGIKLSSEVTQTILYDQYKINGTTQSKLLWSGTTTGRHNTNSTDFLSHHCTVAGWDANGFNSASPGRCALFNWDVDYSTVRERAKSPTSASSEPNIITGVHKCKWLSNTVFFSVYSGLNTESRGWSPSVTSSDWSSLSNANRDGSSSVCFNGGQNGYDRCNCGSISYSEVIEDTTTNYYLRPCSSTNGTYIDNVTKNEKITISGGGQVYVGYYNNTSVATEWKWSDDKSKWKTLANASAWTKDLGYQGYWKPTRSSFLSVLPADLYYEDFMKIHAANKSIKEGLVVCEFSKKGSAVVKGTVGADGYLIFFVNSAADHLWTDKSTGTAKAQRSISGSTYNYSLAKVSANRVLSGGSFERTFPQVNKTDKLFVIYMPDSESANNYITFNSCIVTAE